MDRKRTGYLLLAFFVASLVACGGGSDAPAQISPEPAPAPSPTPSTPNPVPAPTASVDQVSAALALYESAALHARLVAAPLLWMVDDRKILMTTGPCIFGSGSVVAALDGATPVGGSLLPTGRHAYDVSFNSCLVDGLVGTSLDGRASIIYDSPSASELTAIAATGNSVRARGSVAYYSVIDDVTGSGGGTWSSTRSPNNLVTTYSPAIGSTLVNNRTTNIAAFLSGSYSEIFETNPLMGGGLQRRFDALSVSINGTDYVLHGSIWGSTAGTSIEYSGEVRITSSTGTLVARLYGIGSQVRVEVMSPLVPF